MGNAPDDPDDAPLRKAQVSALIGSFGAYNKLVVRDQSPNLLGADLCITRPDEGKSFKLLLQTNEAAGVGNSQFLGNAGIWIRTFKLVVDPHIPKTLSELISAISEVRSGEEGITIEAIERRLRGTASFVSIAVVVVAASMRLFRRA